jgi:hypothetical protein
LNPPDWGGAQTFEQLAEQSEIVAVGSVAGAVSVLADSGRTVHTRYTLRLVELIKKSPGVELGSALRVSIIGGTVTFASGATATVELSRTEYPALNGEYLWFLHVPNQQASIGDVQQPVDAQPTFATQGIYRLPNAVGALVSPCDQRQVPLSLAARGMTRSEILETVRAVIR